MYLLLGIIIVVIGLVMLINPDLVYEITQGWKNSSVNTYPSELYVKSTKIGGCFFVVAGIIGVIGQFIYWFA